MDNQKILKLLEGQRDALFNKLNSTSISELHKKEYADLKSGRMYVLGNQKPEMLSDLEKLSKDTSLDPAYKDKLGEYLRLDNDALIVYFEKELDKLISQITSSGKQNEIQALFIEYNYYYDFTSYIICYGRQQYPLIESPRYISDEYDYNKRVSFLENGINFKPAWVDCEEFADLDYLEISFELENLFELHSRVLLHNALRNLEIRNRLDVLKNRPFYFYINEHDSEVMILYLLQ